MRFFNNKSETVVFAAKIKLGGAKTQFEKLFLINRFLINYSQYRLIEMPKGHLLIFDYGVLASWRVKPAFHVLYFEGVYAEDNYGKTGLNQKHSYFSPHAQLFLS